jgi:hypothetical protein
MTHITFEPKLFEGKQIINASECVEQGLVEKVDVSFSNEGFGSTFLDESNGQKSDISVWLSDCGEFVLLDALRETSNENIASHTSMLLHKEKAEALKYLLIFVLAKDGN